MPHNIFTYGSLMFPEVWRHVVRGCYRNVPATLAGYCRYALLNELYPGMIVQPEGVVHGMVYLDVNAADVLLLDRFEGETYKREAVEIRLDDGRMISAWSYLFLDSSRILKQAWKPETFEPQLFLQYYRSEK